jgi:hypothetical protein
LPLTQFYHFVITLADAIVPDLELDGTADRRYQIVETPQRGWAISEDRRPIALADEQQARLAQLLAALERLPDPGVDQALAAAMAPGSASSFRLATSSEPTAGGSIRRPAGCLYFRSADRTTKDLRSKCAEPSVERYFIYFCMRFLSV